jgi:hypothetical protein
MLKHHLTLIKSINNGERSFFDLTHQEFWDVIEASRISGDLTALKVFENIHTSIYDYDERIPEWLGSKFEAPEWVLKFGKCSKTIRWDSVYLDDGSKLTDSKHTKLLNVFKYWLTASNNPLDQGGKVISNASAREIANKIIVLINAILLHSAELKLAEHHLLHVNDDFWLNVIIDLAKAGGVDEGIYKITERTKKLLDVEIKYISDEEVESFRNEYPHITSKLASDDVKLDLNNRQKSCMWLFKQGYYRGAYKGRSKGYMYSGRAPILHAILFNGKCLFDDIRGYSYPELFIKPKNKSTEYKSVENVDYSGSSTSLISAYISAAKLINTNIDRTDTCLLNPINDKFSTNVIAEIEEVKLKIKGRTRTLPASFVFNVVQQCYEFTIENQESLLDTCFNVLKSGTTKSGTAHSNPYKLKEASKAFEPAIRAKLSNTERGHWLDFDAIHCVSDEWLEKGIKQVLSFPRTDKYRHRRIRNNESLFDLFSVLQGTVQMLTGIIMARRQDEMVQLKASGNLVPNENPFLDDDDYSVVEVNDPTPRKKFKTKYSLKFKLKKSGTKGENTTIERPIPTSIAKFIWLLEQFNIKAEKAGINKGKLTLFNNLNSQTCQLSAGNKATYNDNFDAMCDFFETDIVLYENDEYRRNYIRQHQLRRIFAMIFFWSKGYKGMDALRWMLGHTDMEHLYSYISESETGAVMNGVKAGVLMQGVVNKDIDLADMDTLEKLEELIAKNITGDKGNEILIMPTSEALDYDDESYATTPHISHIKREQEIETEILRLLDNEIITLAPNFFTVTAENGEVINTFNLVLKIKDLD